MVMSLVVPRVGRPSHIQYLRTITPSPPFPPRALGPLARGLAAGLQWPRSGSLLCGLACVADPIPPWPALAWFGLDLFLSPPYAFVRARYRVPT